MMKPDVTEPRVGRGGRWGERTFFFCMAEEAWIKGRTEEMLDNLRQLLRLKSGWGELESFEDSLADAYMRQERVDDAIVEYERALRVFPGMAIARYH